jgi:hypothetical protein
MEVRRWWATAYGQWVRVVAFDLFLLFSKVCAESYTALGTRVPRVIHLALGTGLCAGPAVPGALCRELPLGTGCAESIQPCAEWVRLSAEAPIPVVYMGIIGNIQNNNVVIYEIKSFYVTLAVGKFFPNNMHRANYHFTHNKKLKKNR